MGKVIAIANQKGGVGKTTTAVNLSACLAEKDYKVMIIDLDPQGNTTSGYGIEKLNLKKSTYEVLLGDETIEACIIKKEQFKVDVLPASIDLAGAEVELIDIERRESILKRKLQSVKDNYDFILIDCPPSLNMLTINAFMASDSVLVPIQCEFYALEGLGQLINTINLVKQRLNPKIEIEGVLFTMYDPRTNLCNQVCEEVRKYLPEKTYKTTIPRNVRLGEAPSFGMPVIFFDSKSRGSESYRNLTVEFLQKNGLIDPEPEEPVKEKRGLFGHKKN